MAEGRQASEWSRLSFLLAMIHNRSGFGTDEPKSPNDFNYWNGGSGGASEAAIEIPLFEMAKMIVNHHT
jgi:hypothetical protein